MKRSLTMLTLVACLAAPAAALADSVSDSIARQLRDLGYREITVSRTLLGRTRIVARAKGTYREIIVNPRTGEILRDFWKADDARGSRILGPDDNDYDNDDDDDDDDDDSSSNSGSGSSNSGSGSSNSGSGSSNSGSGSSNSGSGSNDDDDDDDD